MILLRKPLTEALFLTNVINKQALRLAKKISLDLNQRRECNDVNGCTSDTFIKIPNDLQSIPVNVKQSANKEGHGQHD